MWREEGKGHGTWYSVKTTEIICYPLGKVPVSEANGHSYANCYLNPY